MPGKNDILQGTLTLLILKTLSTGSLHGYAITQRIAARSSDALRVEEGSLYPALHRMEQQGWIRSQWGVSESNRKARVYELTAAGKKELAAERDNWRRLTTAVDEILGFA